MFMSRSLSCNQLLSIATGPNIYALRWYLSSTNCHMSKFSFGLHKTSTHLKYNEASTTLRSLHGVSFLKESHFSPSSSYRSKQLLSNQIFSIMSSPSSSSSQTRFIDGYESQISRSISKEKEEINVKLKNHHRVFNENGHSSNQKKARLETANGEPNKIISNELDSPIKIRTYQDVVRDISTLQSNADAIATAAGIEATDKMALLIEHMRMAGINLDDLNKLNIIHVSGTKGKGSTCAFLESILRTNNLKTGFFNSPHLVKYTERIRLNGQPISDEKFIMYFSTVFDRLKLETEHSGIRMPAFFAFMTILAFHTFLKEEIQVAIMEVGIGGLLDTTNVIEEPVVCGITSLDYDHLSILGDTMESIAKQKAGIIKRKIPVYTVDQPKEGMKVIEAQANFMDAPLYVCPPIERYDYDGELKLGIGGQAQGTNASLAVQLARAWMTKQVENFKGSQRSDELNLKLDNMFIKGLIDCRWPGRCQIVKLNNITFFLDGAHTRNSILNCKNWFHEESAKAFKEEVNDKVNQYLILNIIGDRSRESLMELLIDLKLKAAIFTTNRVSLAPTTDDGTNVTTNGEKFTSSSHQNAKIWKSLLMNKNIGLPSHDVIEVRCTLEAIEYICRESRKRKCDQHHVLVTGSLHLVGSIFEALDQMKSREACVQKAAANEDLHSR